MNGHWQKEIPKRSGLYWTATRDGYLNRPLHVTWNGDTLIQAGGTPRSTDPAMANNTFNFDSTWKGWWWSEPIDAPAPPPSIGYFWNSDEYPE